MYKCKQLLICVILVFNITDGRHRMKSLKELPWMSLDKLTFLVMSTDDGDLVPAIIKGTAPNPSFYSEENVKFYLYTRERQNTSFQLYINDTDNLLQSGFNVNNATKFIIHGFANTIEGDVVQAIKNSYLNESWYNVIGVDWSPLCSPPYYYLAVENIEPVGGYVAQMIDYLIGQNLSIDLIHVIGHSLGAHVAGTAGSKITQGILPRITGLDPARPLFDLNHTNYRLDATDALFVDCIHTCGGYLGFYDPICSVDFYPNGGTDPQPGCTWDVFGICSHGRSYYYFAESINRNSVPFIAIKCEFAEDIEDVTLCDKNITTIMGNYVPNNTSGVYYLKTGSEPPYSTSDFFDDIGLLQKILWFFMYD